MRKSNKLLFSVLIEFKKHRNKPLDPKYFDLVPDLMKLGYFFAKITTVKEVESEYGLHYSVRNDVFMFDNEKKYKRFLNERFDTIEFRWYGKKNKKAKPKPFYGITYDSNRSKRRLQRKNKKSS